MRDTSSEAAAVLRRRILAMTPAERFTEGVRTSLLARQIMRAGIRRRHPTYTPQEVEQALARLLWGDALYRAARPEWPLLDP